MSVATQNWFQGGILETGKFWSKRTTAVCSIQVVAVSGGERETIVEWLAQTGVLLGGNESI